MRVITDGIGTDSRLPMFAQWKESGVEHRIYNPHLLFGPQGWLRTHRKLAVIDGTYAFCGGINIVDDFDQSGEQLAMPRWDFAMEARGPVVEDVREAFDTQWQCIRLGVKPRQPSGDKPPSRFGTRRAARAARGNPRGRSAVRRVRRARQSAEPPGDREGVSARHRARRARSAASCRVASCGVRVPLVIGRKEFVALDYATPFFYGNLLKHGVRIAEYEKTILHGKVAVVDSDWATIGSSNLDALSLVLNNEANMVLVNHPEIGALHDAIL